MMWCDAAGHGDKLGDVSIKGVLEKKCNFWQLGLNHCLGNMVRLN